LNYGKDGELDDPELIYVRCVTPENALLYVEIQELIKYIQQEFDMSWAILGETYGLSKGTKIKFRRIMSNLEDENFLKDIKYVPQKIAFTVDSNISKLLVAPLYGDNPIYGIRELVQNATDACKERMSIEQRKENTNYNPLVTVAIDEINEKQYKFTIVDNGRGMNLYEILNYFLSVGSSFRQDIGWKKEFSSVNRNGKFGIGILAAFLLGDEIAVKTRSYEKDAEAYTFKIRLNNENIDIEKLDNCDIGTTIEILMPYEKCAFLSKERYYDFDILWTDWYINKVPRVQYFQNGNEITNSIVFDISMVRNICPANYGKVQWEYLDKRDHICMFVSCNDIIITTNSRKNAFKYIDEENDSHKDNDSYSCRSDVISIIKPSLKIEDPNGILPLKLDRNDLETDILPFEKELIEDVSKDFIAQLLNLQIDSKNILDYTNCICHHRVDFLFSKNGFILNSDYFTNDKIKKSNLLRPIKSNEATKDFSLDRFILNSDYFTNDKIEKLNLLRPIKREKTTEDLSLIFEDSNNIITSPITFDDQMGVLPNNGCCILISKARCAKYQQNYLDIFYGTFFCEFIDNDDYKDDYKCEWETENYIVYSIKNYEKNSNIFDKRIGISIMDNIKKNVMAILELPHTCNSILKGGKILNKQFEKYFGNNYIIPYDMEERRRIYEYAFNDLKDYMKDYEKKLTTDL